MSTLFPGTLSSCPLKRGSRGLRAGAEIWNSDANTIRIKFSAAGHRQDGSPGWKNIADRPEVPSRSGGDAHPHGWHWDPLGVLCVFRGLPRSQARRLRPLGKGKTGEGSVVVF